MENNYINDVLLQKIAKAQNVRISQILAVLGLIEQGGKHHNCTCHPATLRSCIQKYHNIYILKVKKLLIYLALAAQPLCY